MKLKFILILQLFIFTACPTLMAQPAAVKNVAKSVFSLTTFSADGSLLANSHGVFVGADGEAVSDLKPFIGAAKAVVVDAQGNKMNVTRILGLNELYDVIRFRVDGKTTPANIANVASTYQQDAWLVTYAMKSPQIVATKVKSVEKFMDKYSYYIFGMNAPDNSTGCPFVKKIGIPAAMPADESQARIMLIMSGQSGDSLKHVAAVNDFIQAFPLLNDGYNARAILEANAQQWNNAEETMKTAIKKATLKDEAHYNFAKLQYDNAIYGRHWTLDGAYEEVSEAYKLNPAPLYRHLQAQIHYAKNDYQQALEILQQLSQDKQFSTPELLYEQALCKQKLNSPTADVIALLDSAINTTDTLRLNEAAPYFLSRAQAFEEEGKYRDAVFDYTRYEYLMRGQVNSQFYFLREQAEMKGKLYQQVIADIARAIILSPQEPTYYAEMANVQLRVNKPEDAIKTAKRCIEIAPEYSEGYLILGLAQLQTKQKQEGLANLQKAKELGNEQAQSLIDKYGK